MNIFFLVLIAGFAASYISEVIGLMLEGIFNPKLVKHIATLPLAFIACWYLDIFGFSLVVSGFAAAFVATALRVILDGVTSKPQAISRNINRLL